MSTVTSDRPFTSPPPDDTSGDPVVPNAAMIPFDKLPLSDTCWSLSTGPDDRIYAAACTEHTNGVSAYLVRYTPAEQIGEGKLEYLFDIGQAVGEPPATGRASQCKVHYCLLPDPVNGILYGATHLSGGPINERHYSWMSSWKEMHRSFRGSFLFAFDTNNDKLLWTDLCYPWEGSRCMAIDNDRNLIHGVGFPRSHYFIYDLETRTHKDLGRTGSVNPQAIWLDSKNNAYTTDDYGYILRCNPNEGKLRRLDIRSPFANFTDGWHNVAYDIVPDPNDPDAVYGCSWNYPSHIFRYRMDPNGGPGEMTDFGPALDLPYKELSTFFSDHVGGMVFGDDGMLYYVASDMERESFTVTTGHRCWLMKMDPKTGEKQKIGRWFFGEFKTAYISRAARTKSGRMLFGDCIKHPSRMYEFQPDMNGSEPVVTPPLRLWG